MYYLLIEVGAIIAYNKIELVVHCASTWLEGNALRRQQHKMQGESRIFLSNTSNTELIFQEGRPSKAVFRLSGQEVVETCNMMRLLAIVNLKCILIV